MGKQKTTKRVPLNLLGEDAELAERLRSLLEKKMGKLSAIQVARMAYRALEASVAGRQ